MMIVVCIEALQRSNAGGHLDCLKILETQDNDALYAATCKVNAQIHILY